MFEIIVRLILLITLFCLLLTWTLTSPFSFKSYFFSFFNLRGLLLFFFESILLLQLLDILIFPLPSIGFDYLVILIGLVINSLGAILAIWAKLEMGTNWGKPAQHNVERQKILVTKGPFSLLRNPIYLGLLMVLVGIELVLRSAFIVLAIPLFFLFYKAILIEENLLEKHFSGKYKIYKKKVPRFFSLKLYPF